CTLRLRSELPLIANAGTAGAQYEDVVWMTPLFFPLPGDKLQTRKRPVIGISMYPIGAVYRKLHLVFFSLLARVRSDCDFVFFEVKFASEGKKVNQALRPKRALTLPNCRFYKFTSVEDGIQFLSSLDLLLTSRLHILITALSYRIPCISLLPRPKTVMYLQETGLDRFCWTRKRLWKLIYLLIPPLFKGLLRSVKPLDPISFQRSAAFHFRDLERNLRDL